MIDKEWLESLRFETSFGFSIDGLAGIGAEHIVLNVNTKDGEQSVLKTPVNHLGFHIKEVPLYLSGTPKYQLDRLNNKLSQLVGNPLADTFFNDIDRLYQSVLRFCYDIRNKGDVSYLPLLPHPLENMAGLIKTPSFIRRLTEIATLNRSESDEGFFAKVSGPDFKIEGVKNHLIDWANNLLDSINSLSIVSDLEPETLVNNPILIWASAAADGFFTDDEIPVAVEYMEAKYGRLRDRDDVAVIVAQLSIVATLMKCLIKEPSLDRFGMMCKEAGAIFQVFDKDGTATFIGMPS